MSISAISAIAARAVNDAELAAAEPVLEDFDLPGVALDNLVELTGVDRASLEIEDGWRASVEVEGTPLIVCAGERRWSIFADPAGDPGDAMSAARKLHGLLGEKVEGWDLDR